MKKINLAFLCLILLFACTKTVDRPKLTISEYTRQSVIIKGVLEKILAEEDYKKMHEIASAVESSRAVDCVSIDRECDIYGEVLNKIVSSTKNGLPGEADNRAIYKKIGELDQAIISGQEKLAGEWKAYIKGHGKEEK
ncbi:MAG: hypothetical protein ACXVLQ_10525 [Bacteriovorax sp.]